ncbi:mrpl15rplO [Acrasis kona]|uniref:Mrpl15rplO n=1 Tax=Acrasis kona TaxID=1008807 RepID=A0AAW2Z7B6_9EUKA
MLSIRRCQSFARHIKLPFDFTSRSYRVQLGVTLPNPDAPIPPQITQPPSDNPHDVYWHFHRLGKENRNRRPTPQYRKKRLEEFVLGENSDVQDIALNTLKYMPYSKKLKKRLGRGRGANHGLHGNNGQKQRRSVNIPNLFEGGQTPIFKRIPKLRWRNAAFKKKYKPLNLEKLQYFIDTGRIDASSGTINLFTLRSAGLIGDVRWPGVKLLASGYDNFTAKIDIEVPRASMSAIKAVENAGGSIRCVYYNKRSLRMLLAPHRYEKHYTESMGMPPPKLFSYYMRKNIRGYLAVAGFDKNGINEHEKVPDHEEETERKRAEKVFMEHSVKQKKKGK